MSTKDQSKAKMQSFMDGLQELMDDSDIKRTEEIGIKYEGEQITLPNSPRPMQIPQAIDVLQKTWQLEESTVEVTEIIKAYPWDGAQAFMKALKEKFGWSRPVPTPGFFGASPPEYRTIETAKGKTAQVIWGSFEVAPLDCRIETQMTRDRGRWVMAINATIKQKDAYVIKDLADLTRKIVQEDSIYKGQAFELVLGDNDIDYSQPPMFLSTNAIKPEDVIFSKEVAAAVNTNLYAPIRHTDVCEANGISVNRGILLEGPYGVGKTMVAAATSYECVENDWTFILVPNARALKAALRFAEDYQPAVVFAEDVDKAVGEHRTDDVNDILNTVDGVTSKDVKIITILTTNHVDNVNKAMLRPGRLDAVISVEPPDAEAAIRLVEKYAGVALATGQDLTNVGDELQGKMPATIREVVDRSKLFAIGSGNIDEQGRPSIAEDDLIFASRSMDKHLEKLNKQPDAETPSELFVRALGGIMTPLVSKTFEEHREDTLKHIKKLVQG